MDENVSRITKEYGWSDQAAMFVDIGIVPTDIPNHHFLQPPPTGNSEEGESATEDIEEVESEDRGYWATVGTVLF